MYNFNFDFNFNKNKKIIYPVALALCFMVVFGLGIWIGANKLAYHVQQPGTIDFSLFWDAYNKLQENFIDPGQINNQKIIYGAIEGMAKSLGDPYTSFFEPEQAERFQQDLSGSFEGIGAEIGIKKDQLTIIAPLEGTPAQQAGLKSGDIILKINGEDSVNMTTDEAVSLIRGKKGTEVVLTIYRNSWSEPKDIKIIRDTIKIDSVKWSLKNNDTAYIQIFQFDESLSPDFKNITHQILQSQAKKIIIDLRDNPGGYLDIAREISGYFMEGGQIVAIEDFGGGKNQEIYKTDGNSEFSDYPLVVLINQGSASASEILAGALRDNRETILIGMKSFGKGSVQKTVSLIDGSLLKITIAKWLTPKGNSISEVGLEPDIKVDITDDDIKQGIDPQLEKALEIIEDLK